MNFRLVWILGVLACLVQASSCFSECQKTPRWRLNDGKLFPNHYTGKLKFVALLQATCPFCIKQAKNLGDLRVELLNENIADVDFVIVNTFEAGSYNLTSRFEEVTDIPVLQDNEQMGVWKMYNGETDDMLIFDKCNRLVRHLKLPNDSIVHTGAVKRAILKAYHDEPCGRDCRFRRKKTQLANN